MTQLKFFNDSGAEFSDDRVYRYLLWRFWDVNKYAAFVGLNPSTADETENDPTVRRCINYAYDWGYGGLMMLNLFAFRSTDPKNLYLVEDPVGPDNDFCLRTISRKAGITIAAWGIHGAYKKRSSNVIKILADPHYLALTKDGEPGHPLYLKKDLKPKRFK